MGATPDILNMSDEELLALDPDSLVSAEGSTESETGDAGDGNTEPAVPTDGAATPAGTNGEGDDGATDGVVDGGDTKDPAASGSATDPHAADPSTAPSVDSSKPVAEEAAASTSADANKDAAASQSKTEPPPADGVDYKAFYERMTAPFKANGRDIQVTSVDDAIALMQMGANYNKKMAALKPNLRLLKMLENSGLLSEEKLSYLIDLSKKSPEAISKLVKDSGIDPLDLSPEKASEYKPNTYAVDEREVELDMVIGEIQDSPAYTRTIEIIGNKWDAASKQTIANSPQILKIINQHIELGIYDMVAKVVENERMFGRLNGMSDLEAYRAVGDALQAKGAFNHLNQPQVQVNPAQPTQVAPKPKVDESKLNEKRRAASSPNPSAVPSAPQGFNPLAMSDEEFAKVGLPQYL